MSYWDEKPAETIEDTCTCGAKFRVTAKYPKFPHETWLKEHSVCRSRKNK